ncbi:MAG: phage virion morphogenesis protein [Piscinibacter sp.]|uniref:phage virion morphogenesis protein n=1 Tax=Piscinibacter sp. TaxID=1903157 RepID=UPI002589D65E|nr:phage virion morphogenesis protein [Piscinibacter sp.]MCW5666526.1 phage virion morphogenesis protein [Piscinibacter sp.]
MVADLKITPDTREVIAALERIRKGLPGEGDMTRPMTTIGRIGVSSTQQRFRSTTGPDGLRWKESRRAKEQGGQTLSASARLRRSLTYNAGRDSVAWGTNVRYAAIHQFGGIIRAKSGPFLAIPVTDAARAAGSPRNMEGLSVAQTLKGQFILVDAKGVTQYLLRVQVIMPARPFLGVSSSDETTMLNALRAHYDGAWSRR